MCVGRARSMTSSSRCTSKPIADGTRVRVDGIVPDGKIGGAGLSFVRMTPEWLPTLDPAAPDAAARAVASQRHRPLREAGRGCPLAVRCVRVRDDDVDSPTRTPRSSRGSRSASATAPSCCIPPSATPTGVTHQPFVYVDDLEAHFATASAAGATIVEPIKHHGFKAYVAEDLEGRRWTFAQARPTQS